MPVTEKDVRKRLKHGGKLHNCTAQTTRFELPFDLQQLEGLGPRDYLRNYAVVSNKRIFLYQRVYQKFRNPTTNMMESKELGKCVADMLVGGISKQRLDQLRELAGVADLDQLDPQIFFAFCAVVERQTAGKSGVADSPCGASNCAQRQLGDLVECRRQSLESADFAGLQFKLRGIRVTEELARLLMAL